MSQIRVVVNGVLGRMGQQVVSAVASDVGLELVGGADIRANDDHLAMPGKSTCIPLCTDLNYLLESSRPDVLVDFSIAEAAITATRLALKGGTHVVIGTTGLNETHLAEINELAIANNKGAIVAANFAIGAVVLMHLAKVASKYFDNAEIIELHHDKKVHRG